MEKEVINSFVDKKVCIIGDTIIDVEYNCEAVGLSLETPTLKSKLINEVSIPGGAFGVYSNLNSLSDNCNFVSLSCGPESNSVFSEYFPSTPLLKTFKDSEKLDNIKRRYWIKKGNERYKYFQLNSECKKPISKKVEDEVINYLKDFIKDFDTVVLSDYQCGFLTTNVIKYIIKICNENSVNTIINCQISSNGVKKYEDFINCGLLCLNEDEYKIVKKHFNCLNEFDLSNKMNCSLCITKGKKGSELIFDNKSYTSPSYDVKVVDTCGAGDSFLACLSLCDYKKSPIASLNICNYWASKYVSTSKNVFPSVIDLKNKFLV